MTISAVEIEIPLAHAARLTQDTLHVDLADGRTISVPLAWYPRLLHATPDERDNWRLIGKGKGIHWEAIDEDISVEGLLAGRASAESQASLKKWLASRPPCLTSRSSRRVKAPCAGQLRRSWGKIPGETGSRHQWGKPKHPTTPVLGYRR